MLKSAYTCGRRYLEYEEGRAIGELPLNQGHRHIVDRDARARLALEGASMGVPVEGSRHRIAGHRLLKPTRAEESEYLRRLSFHRLLYGRIMEHRYSAGSA